MYIYVIICNIVISMCAYVYIYIYHVKLHTHTHTHTPYSQLSGGPGMCELLGAVGFNPSARFSISTLLRAISPRVQVQGFGAWAMIWSCREQAFGARPLQNPKIATNDKSLSKLQLYRPQTLNPKT